VRPIEGKAYVSEEEARARAIRKRILIVGDTISYLGMVGFA
jgi:hypothetical protein